MNINLKNKNILISGAGIAGLSLAYWLKQYGFTPTLIERSELLRTGGYKVDIRGSALEVIKKMGIHSEIFNARTDIKGATVVDSRGNKITEMSGDTFGLSTNEDLEILRGNLCEIIMKQIEDVEVIFGEFVTRLSQKTDGIYVEFKKSNPRTFDLVIGADGLHSAIRKLAFDGESYFSYDLNMYIAIFTIPNYLHLDRWEIECSENKRLINLYSSRDKNAKVAFLFHNKNVKKDIRDIKQQKCLIEQVYSDMEWEIPKFLQLMNEATDLYFDSITQIYMDSWYNDRIVLAGDAGYCASPISGQGTSVALVGSYVLAGELFNLRVPYFNLTNPATICHTLVSTISHTARYVNFSLQKTDNFQ